jgi:tight adherence protein B
VNVLAMTLLGLAAWLAERGSRAARRGGLRRRIGVASPERSGVTRTAPIWPIWGLVGATLGYVLSGVAASIVGAGLGVAAFRARERRRSRALASERDEQLVDAVGSVTAAIRAGRSVPQAISFAAAEAPAPLGESLRRVETALELGTPLDHALEGWAAEVDTGDARLLAGVLTLHRRSGGDLPSVLDEVADSLRERRAGAREVRALTAQARLSGTILGVLPFGFFAFLWLTSRSEIEGALRTPAGIVAIGLGLALEGLAFLWIRRLLEVQ